MPKTSPTQAEKIRQSFPRRHDILWHPEATKPPNRASTSDFVAEDLSAFETFQKLRQLPLTMFDKPQFEVHYVDKERELMVKEASRWLQEFKDTHGK